MSAVSKDYAALAASTSTLLESSMMEGDELYDPTTTPIANEEWSKKGGTSNLCRICANTSDYFIPIFEGEGLEHELSEKIDKHLPIKVRDSDSLPIHVCYQCASTLIAWHDLLLNCVEAEKKLLQIQQQVEQDDLEESKVIEFDAPSMDSDTAEDSVEATTPLVTPEEMEKSAPSTSKKNTSIKERPSLKRSLVKKSASSQKKARKTETEKSPVEPEDGPAEETVVGRCDVPPPMVWIKSEEGEQNALEGFISRGPVVGRSSTVVHLKQSQSLSNSVVSATFKTDVRTSRSERRLRKVKSLVTDGNSQEMLGSISYECCSKRFTRKIDLRRHKMCHLQNFEKVSEDNLEDITDLGVEENIRRVQKCLFHCSECGRNFTLKDSYFRHRRIHTGEKPFTCHVCGKQFRDSGGLARHLKDVHAGIKNFACDLCGRTFASKATKEDHRRIHTGERPYICHSCGKTFRSKASLYIHAKTHTDLYPHACTYCDKQFRRRQELLAHVSTHTGEKPYPCEVCGRFFRVRGELHRHRLIHSDYKAFVCSLCGMNFRQKRYLKNHEKARHSKQEVVTHTK